MTPNETIKALRRAGKPIVRSHFYRLTALLKIRPLGRSRPQQYPADTAHKILSHLGFSSAVNINPVERGRSGFENEAPLPSKKLISIRTLRAVRPQTHKTKGKK